MTNATTLLPPTQRKAARTVGWLAVVGAAGSAIMSVAHAGVEIPLISALGPGGDRPVPPAVVAFAVGTALASAVAWGVFSRRRWAWPAAVVLNVLAFYGAVTPFRGAGSVVAIVIAGAALVVLASPPGRAALRTPT